jgi:hypothetical protein
MANLMVGPALREFDWRRWEVGYEMAQAKHENREVRVALLQCQSDCEDWAILFQGLLNSTEKSSEIYSIYKDDCGRDSFKLFTRITGLKSMSEPPARSPIDLSWLWRKS